MKIACAAVVKNEERHIAEWVAYQYALGFDTVILLDNASTDGTVEQALGFADRRDIRIVDWPVTTPDYQMRGYEQVLSRFGREFEWIAFFDTDEFLVLDAGRTLKAMLMARGDAAAIVVPWSIFGSSDHDEAPGGLIIEDFTRRSASSFGPNAHVKSIVRPAAVRAARNPHIFEVDGRVLDFSGRDLEWSLPGVLRHSPVYKDAKLHHYFTRSKAHWRRKLARGYHDVTRGPEVFAQYDRNEVLDDGAARLAPLVRDIMGGAELRAVAPEAMRCGVVLFVKDEASDIITWLAWYDQLGFDTCIVFDDGSTDGTREILQRAAKLQDIRLFDALGPKDDVLDVRQRKSYSFAIDTFGASFDWLAFLDADEFLMLYRERTIKAFLGRFPDADAVAVNWCNYGSGGHVLKPPIPPFEAFTWHGGTSARVNRHVKSIVRPAKLRGGWVNVHTYDIDPARYVLADGRKPRWSDTPGIIADDPDWSAAKVMHFQCRSMEHFIERIRRRPELATVPDLWRHYDVNLEEDRAALEWAPAVRARIARLQGEPPPAAPAIQIKPAFSPNPMGTQGFVFGWEKALLGNCLSAFANLFALSERTGTPIAYPQVLQTRPLIGIEGGAHGYIHGALDARQESLMDGVAEGGEAMFGPGYADYMARSEARPLAEIERLHDAQGILFHARYDPHFCDLAPRQEEIRRFCARGNAIMLPGAYWNQYLDMRPLREAGVALRRKLRVAGQDQVARRATEMREARGARIIGIHYRTGDYRNWHGGRYLFTPAQIAAVIRNVHESLGAQPHLFCICAQQEFDPAAFDGLPVILERGGRDDDFVALSRCDVVIGPPSTFGTWAAFLGNAERMVLTPEVVASLSSASILDEARDVIYPTGGYLPGDPAAAPV